jgi:hypothetical protein
VPIRYKHSVYATMMSCGREVIDRRKLSTDEVAGFLDRYPVDKVAIESSTSIVPVYRALRGKGYTIIIQARPYVVIADV